MNKKKLVIPALIILVLSGLFAVANTYHWFGMNRNNTADLPAAKEELRKVFARFSDPASIIHIRGTIRLFDRENNDALKEQISFSYSKQGQQFSSRVGYVQTFVADSLAIQLDTVNKYIILSRVDKGSELLTAQTALPFEKFMQDTSAFKIEAVVAQNNKERSLAIKSELSPEIKMTTIFYDPVTYTIKRAEIEWWKEPLVYKNEEDFKRTWLTVLEYTYPLSGGASVSEKIRKIIIQKDGKIEPGPAYRDYQVQSSF
ncbi:MAG: hypothetical protein JNK14_16040 [Chitinophagaceae bacterium]|nr:hypothetical protein [Chitinophagaceae bacterium]